MMGEACWWVYLLECRSGRIYTGVTPILERRMAAHRRGRGARFTKMDPPVRLLAAKPFPNKIEALKIERQVKGVGAAHKRALAVDWSQQNPIDERAQKALSLD